MDKNEVSNIEDTINSIRKVDLSISNYEWLRGSIDNGKNFFDAISKENDSFSLKLRQLLDEFDKTINPYMNKAIELDDFEKYNGKLEITCLHYNSVVEFDNLERDNCCMLIIKDKNSKNRVSYYRNATGFSYQLQYQIEEEKNFSLVHYYDIFNKSEDSGEVVFLHIYGNNTPSQADFRYNITHKNICSTDTQKIPITDKDREFIYKELLLAVELASSITIDNMVKNKKLIKE